MHIGKSAVVIACLVLTSHKAIASEPAQHILGHYSDQQLGAIKSITLPRTFL